MKRTPLSLLIVLFLFVECVFAYCPAEPGLDTQEPILGLPLPAADEPVMALDGEHLECYPAPAVGEAETAPAISLPLSTQGPWLRVMPPCGLDLPRVVL